MKENIQIGERDPEDPKSIDFTKRKSFEGFEVDENNYPLNPKDKSLKNGRGVLWKWGPNLAGDPVVTKTDSDEKNYILLIKRGNGKWAFPGGMQNDNEDLRDTVSRELFEETNVKLDFSKAKEIYSGYVDDPRNTRHAWIETLALHYNLNNEETSRIKPKAGDDARDIDWFLLEDKTLASKMHANHYEILNKIRWK